MPIINQVVKGGGTTPTGTKSITTNGVYDVTDYASADVQVPTTAPAYYVEKTVDANGKLTSNGVTNFISLTGVTDIDDSQLYYAYHNAAIAGAIDLSSLTTITGNTACAYTFARCSNITNVDLSSLTTINGNSACIYMFESSSVSSVDFSSLTTITKGCNYMFQSCRSLISISFPSLTTANGCQNMFENCTNLTNADLPALVSATAANACNLMFKGCNKLSNVNLSSLTTASGNNYVLYYMFSGCTSLTRMDFPSLTTISTGAGLLGGMFYNCTSLTNVYFYALTPSSFGSQTSQFNKMLSGVTGCTVHFPMAIQSTIGSWSDVTAGFGGTNTTVLFDIVTSLTGADSNTYTRKQKESTSTATAWTYNDTLYYTSGTTEPTVGATIYSDSACTTAVTTISSIA